MKAVRKLLVSMELHLDASIDKVDNLAMNVQIDKEKRVENTKSEKQNVPDRAEAERRESMLRLCILQWWLKHMSISIMPMHLRLEVVPM